MNHLNSILAAAPLGLSLSLGEWLDFLRLRGRIVPSVREAVAEELCVRAARDAGLVVAAADLQRAADEFRTRQGLQSGGATNAWLAEQHLSVLDLENVLERDLLVEKFRDHLFHEQGPNYFQANRDRLVRAKVRQLLVASAGLARELLHQMEEGAAFAEVARRHSLDASRERGGDIGILCRAHLPEPLAAPIFAAAEGDIVGPILADGGYHVYRIEQHLPAEMDEPTALLIRKGVCRLVARETGQRFAEAGLVGGQQWSPLMP